MFQRFGTCKNFFPLPNWEFNVEIFIMLPFDSIHFPFLWQCLHSLKFQISIFCLAQFHIEIIIFLSFWKHFDPHFGSCYLHTQVRVITKYFQWWNPMFLVLNYVDKHQEKRKQHINIWNYLNMFTLSHGNTWAYK